VNLEKSGANVAWGCLSLGEQGNCYAVVKTCTFCFFSEYNVCGDPRCLEVFPASVIMSVALCSIN